MVSHVRAHNGYLADGQARGGEVDRFIESIAPNQLHALHHFDVLHHFARPNWQARSDA